MDLKDVLLFVGVFCFSCSAHKTVFRENAIIENGKTNSWEFGLSLFPSGLITPDLKLPHLSGHCKEDFNRYRNAILNPDRTTLWAYKSKNIYLNTKFYYYEFFTMDVCNTLLLSLLKYFHSARCNRKISRRYFTRKS